MRKLWYIAKYDLKKRTKGLIISFVIIFIFSFFISNLGNIISSVVSPVEILTKYNVVSYNDTTINLSEYLTGDGYKYFESFGYELVDTASDTKITKADFTSNKDYLDTSLYLELAYDENQVPKFTILENPIMTLNINVFILDMVTKTLVSNQFSYSSDYNTNYVLPTEVNTDLKMVLYMIGSLPMFILMSMAYGLITSDIIQEKTSKSIEIILTSISSSKHFFAKITGTALFGIIMAIGSVILFLISSLIGQVIFPSPATETPPDEFTSMVAGINIVGGVATGLITLVVGLVLVLGILATLSSFANGQEDASSLVGPYMIFNVIGFYATIFLPTIPGGVGITVLKVLTFIPVFTPYILTGLVLNNNVNFLFALINILTTAGFTVLAIRLFLPIYKISILNYNNDPMMKRIKTIIKESYARKHQAKVDE